MLWAVDISCQLGKGVHRIDEGYKSKTGCLNSLLRQSFTALSHYESLKELLMLLCTKHPSELRYCDCIKILNAEVINSFVSQYLERLKLVRIRVFFFFKIFLFHSYSLQHACRHH